MYYVFGERLGKYSDDHDEYYYDALLYRDEAMRDAAHLMIKGYEVTVVSGEKIKIDEEIFAKVTEAEEKKKKRKIKKEEKERLEAKKRQFESLRKELGL